MRPEAIFAPLCVLALWTEVVVFLVGFNRIRAVRARRVAPGAFRLGESADVPADVSVWNRNLINLLETPTLFYVVGIAVYVTHHVTPDVLILAWIFVAFRLAHSLIHVTSNRILMGLTLYAVSNFVLLGLWLRFVSQVL
jgi:hypothetical protein